MIVILHLFVLFLLVLLGFYIFVADPRKRAHQTFAGFILLIALWTTKDLIFWDFPNETISVETWTATTFSISMFLQFALIVFAWTFPENSPTRRKTALVLFSPGFVFIAAAFFGLFWRRVGFENGQFSIELSPTAYLFVAYVYGLFLYGFYELFKKLKVAQTNNEKKQVLAMIAAVLITVILKSIANIVFPFFGNYSFLPHSTFFALPGVLICAYAISSFKLFSLQSALDEFRLFPVTYKIAGTIAAVAVLSFVIFQIPIVWWSFANGMDEHAWRKYLVFSLISALIPNLLLVLLIVRSISRPLHRITVAAVQVADGDYGATVDLRKSNDEIGILADSVNEMSRKIASDIDRMRELNEMLLRNEKLAAMGVVAAGIAHEVNNPLASISSMIQLLRSKDQLPPEINEKLSVIASQIERIAHVTRDMTNFASTRSPKKKTVMVSQIVKKTVELLGETISSEPHKITLHLAEKENAIQADADQLQQVILNIVLNAFDAIDGDGAIEISTEFSAHSALISISDNGVGIDEKHVGKVFDPFFTTKPAGKGSGLGLAICRGIVEAHGGSLTVEPNAPKGTVFRLSLPY